MCVLSFLGKKNQLPPQGYLSHFKSVFSAGLLGALLFPALAIAESITYNNGPSTLLRDPVVYFPGSNNASNYTPQIGALFPITSSYGNTVNFINGNIYVANPGVAGRTGPGGDVFGGIGDTSPVTRNTVYIFDGRVSNVYGGLAAGSGVNLRDNTVFIEGGTVLNGVYGGRVILGSNVWAERNAVRINSGEIRGNVYGAYSVVSGTFLQLNNIAINGGYIQGTDAIVSGAYGFVSGIDVRANSVTISGGTIKDANIYGGRGQSALTNTSTIENNTVTISGGLINENFTGKGVYGGQNITGNGAVVRNNRVTITGGTVNANIYGGYNGGNGPTNGNIVDISGGRITGNIYGGRSNTGTATSNIVTIGGSASLQKPNLYGVYGGWVNSGGGDAFTGNILNKNSAATVGAVSNFQFVNFGYSGEANIATLDTTPTGSARPGVTVNTGANRVNFSGDIIGSGSLIKTGTGTLSLSGLGYFTGGTELVAGTLSIANSFALNVANQAISPKAGYVTFTGADTARVTVDSAMVGANSFRTQGTGNYYLDINAPTDIVSVNIADPGGVFYVAPGTTMNVNVASDLRLGYNSANGQWNDLYVGSGGTFKLNLANEATATFASGIAGPGALKISGVGGVVLTNMLYPFNQTFQMGTTEVSGINTGDTAVLWLQRYSNTNPRLTFSNTGIFRLTGNDSSPVAAVLMGDGIVTANTINVTHGGALMPMALSDLDPAIADPGTLTLRAPTINLTDFSLLYRTYASQTALDFSGGDGIPTSNNTLLNLDGTVNVGSAAVYLVTADGTPFQSGTSSDYLLIHSNNGFLVNGVSVTNIGQLNLKAYVDGFLLQKSDTNSPRGGSFGFALGTDSAPSGGTNDIWLTVSNLSSLTMDWTGGNLGKTAPGFWTSDPNFYSLQSSAGVHETYFMSGDEVHVSGDGKFTIELPAASLASKIVVSRLVVGQSADGTVASVNGDYTFTGAGGIIADGASAFGIYVGTSLDPTGKLEKYGDSTLTFANTGSNLFKEGIDLYGGIVAFNQADQLGVGAGAEITFKDDATLRANAGMTLSPAQNIVIEDGKTATFNTQEHALRIDGTISGSSAGDGNLNKLGSGTLTLGGALNSDGASGSYGGDINIAAGTLVFDQSADQTLSGIITGTGTLIKKGVGTLTLNEANTAYAGRTEVRGGTLAFSGPGDITGTLALYDRVTVIAPNATSSSRLEVWGIDNNWEGNLDMTDRSMRFYLPNSMVPDDTMIHVTGGDVAIDGSTVNLTIVGRNSPVKTVGEKIVLIDDPGVSALDVARDEMVTVKLTQDPTVQYIFQVITDLPNRLIARLDRIEVPEEITSLTGGYLTGVILVNRIVDLAAGEGMAAAIEAGKYGRGIFGTISGGKIRHHTGSYVDMTSVSLMTGYAWGKELTPGYLTSGVFFEYGDGFYDTYNLFKLGPVRGDGNVYHIGGGALGRLNFTDTGSGHLYAELAARAGIVHNNYKSFDLLRDEFDNKQKVSYSASSAYYGMYAGMGYIWKVSDKATLDMYGKYFWTRLNGDSARLSTGQTVEFKDVDSHRLRVGGRYSRSVSETVSPYIGAAYEREFDGKAYAMTGGRDIEPLSIRGNTGMAEAGLTYKPTKYRHLTIEAGVQGYTGRREGVTGSLQVRYRF